MTDRRVPGQSLLDYLWSNYGSHFVSDAFEDGSIPSSKLLQDITSNITSNAVNSIKIVGNNLVGTSIDGNLIFAIDISEIISGGRSITNFGKRYISQDDIDAGCTLNIGDPVYFLRFSDNSELLAPIDSYRGAETDSVVITISDSIVSASLKINNEDSIVRLKETKDGLQADLRIAESDSILLTKELEGLKALIILDNQGKTLKFKLVSLKEYLDLPSVDDTTVYFLSDKKYFYFGNKLIGEGVINVEDYYTKEEIDDLQSTLATKEYVDDLIADVGMTWNTI